MSLLTQIFSQCIGLFLLTPLRFLACDLVLFFFHLGGGFESEENYPQWKRVPQNIDRPFSLSESLGKLYEACLDARSSWLNKLENSGWFSYMQDVLETSLQIAKLMHFKSNLDFYLFLCTFLKAVFSSESCCFDFKITFGKNALSVVVTHDLF